MYFNVFKTILGLQLHGHSCFGLTTWKDSCDAMDDMSLDCMTTILRTHDPLSNRLEVEWLIQEEGRNKPNDYNITFNIIYKHCYIICCL